MTLSESINNKIIKPKEKKEGMHMLNYSVRIRTISDLMELKKIAQKFDFDGEIIQNGFDNDIKKIWGSLLYLPLDSANVKVYGYEEADAEDISRAMVKFAA